MMSPEMEEKKCREEILRGRQDQGGGKGELGSG